MRERKKKWYCEDCIRYDNINSLPLLVFRDYIFHYVVLEEERMILDLSLLCKKWNEIIEHSFQNAVHFAWVKREFKPHSKEERERASDGTSYI